MKYKSIVAKGFGISVSLSLAISSSLFFSGNTWARERVSPSFSLQASSDDNLFSSSKDRVQTDVVKLSTGVSYTNTSRKKSFGVGYFLDSGYYARNSNADYVDLTLSSDLGLQLSKRDNLNLNADFVAGHDDRRASDADFSSNLEVDKYDQKQLGAKYRLGRIESKGRVELNLRYTDKEYKGDSSFARSRSRETILLNPEAFWRITSFDTFFLGLEYETSDYKNDPETLAGQLDVLDNKRNQFYGGYLWELSQRTTGSIQLGYTQRDFSDPDRQDFSGLSWKGTAKWAASPRSRFRFAAAKEDLGDTGGLEASRVQKLSSSAQWVREWTRRIESRLDVGIANENYIDAIDNREDTVRKINVQLQYRARKSVFAAVGLSNETSDSSTNNFDFERNVAYFSISFKP